MAEEQKVADNGLSEEEQAKPDADAPADAGGVADPIDDYVPEVRKTAADHFRERHAPRREPVPPKDDDGVGEGEELTPQARTLLAQEVERQVRERMQPFEEVAVKSANEGDINSYVATHPDVSKYRSVAGKFMDAYKGITAENAFLLAEARFGNPVQRGADEQKRRDREANKPRGGSSPRPATRVGTGEVSAEEINAMTPQQFEAFNERIKGGAAVKT